MLNYNFIINKKFNFIIFIIIIMYYKFIIIIIIIIYNYIINL